MDAFRALLARLVGNHWIIGLAFALFGLFGIFNPTAAAGLFFFFLTAVGIAILVYAWEEGAFDKGVAEAQAQIERLRSKAGL
jgi:hypothetical protein